MLDEYLNQKVVVDLSSPFVRSGKLVRYDDHFLELQNADLHDLRDTDTTREHYVAESVRTGHQAEPQAGARPPRPRWSPSRCSKTWWTVLRRSLPKQRRIR